MEAPLSLDHLSHISYHEIRVLLTGHFASCLHTSISSNYEICSHTGSNAQHLFPLEISSQSFVI